MKWIEWTRQLKDLAQMLWKRALSYRKREWELEDYPVRVRVQKDVPEESRYWARILGWKIDGLGRTRADALAELRKWYETRKAFLLGEGKAVPRPGVNVPIEFASRERVSADEQLMDDFVHRVLELPWAFLSDGSTLEHFTADGDTRALVARVRSIYGVDVSDIESENIAEILERIGASRQVEE